MRGQARIRWPSILPATVLLAWVATAAELTVEEELQEAREEIRRLQVQLRGFLGRSDSLVAEETANASHFDGEVLIVDSNSGVVHVEHGNSSEVGMLLQSTTTAAPTAIVAGKSIPLKTKEVAIVVCMFAFILVLFALPQAPPFKFCFERCFHRIYPLIAIVSLVIFFMVMSRLETVTINDIFFAIIKVVEIVLNSLETVLTLVFVVLMLMIAWKFKDRILTALGVDNPVHFIGDFRDWATCWSMRRFHPIELYVLKAENIPAAKLTSSNDLYVEVSLGYNLKTRTRVHSRAGHKCVFKERMQLNFDPYDTNGQMRISVMNQEVVFPSEIAHVQLGASKVAQFEEKGSQERPAAASAISTSAVWASDSFIPIDLIPSGTIYIRVQSSEEGGGGLFSCCCPGS
mmetsp:Transcript_69670/g.167228  ORF Transcript_69670/g.167228 Transcript_69670/m.167228 type:complete len:402 (-) Transcript_69670:98-1303(-)